MPCDVDELPGQRRLRRPVVVALQPEREEHGDGDGIGRVERHERDGDRAAQHLVGGDWVDPQVVLGALVPLADVARRVDGARHRMDAGQSLRRRGVLAQQRGDVGERAERDEFDVARRRGDRVVQQLDRSTGVRPGGDGRQRDAEELVRGVAPFGREGVEAGQRVVAAAGHRDLRAARRGEQSRARCGAGRAAREPGAGDRDGADVEVASRDQVQQRERVVRTHVGVDDHRRTVDRARRVVDRRIPLATTAATRLNSRSVLIATAASRALMPVVGDVGQPWRPGGDVLPRGDDGPELLVGQDPLERRGPFGTPKTKIASSSVRKTSCASTPAARRSNGGPSSRYVVRDIALAEVEREHDRELVDVGVGEDPVEVASDRGDVVGHAHGWSIPAAGSLAIGALPNMRCGFSAPASRRAAIGASAEAVGASKHDRHV